MKMSKLLAFPLKLCYARHFNCTSDDPIDLKIYSIYEGIHIYVYIHRKSDARMRYQFNGLCGKAVGNT